MKTFVISCLGLAFLSSIGVAELQYNNDDLMNFISSLLHADKVSNSEEGLAEVDTNEIDGNYPLAKRGAKTQEICRRECSSCTKVMDVLFMHCWRDCQLSNAGQSNLQAWSTCRRFLVG